MAGIARRSLARARGAALPYTRRAPGPRSPVSPGGSPPRPCARYAEVGTSGGSAPVFAAWAYQYALDFGVRVRVA